MARPAWEESLRETSWNDVGETAVKTFDLQLKVKRYIQSQRRPFFGLYRKDENNTGKNI